MRPWPAVGTGCDHCGPCLCSRWAQATSVSRALAVAQTGQVLPTAGWVGVCEGPLGPGLQPSHSRKEAGLVTHHRPVSAASELRKQRSKRNRSPGTESPGAAQLSAGAPGLCREEAAGFPTGFCLGQKVLGQPTPGHPAGPEGSLGQHFCRRERNVGEAILHCKAFGILFLLKASASQTHGPGLSGSTAPSLVMFFQNIKQLNPIMRSPNVNAEHTFR